MPRRIRTRICKRLKSRFSQKAAWADVRKRLRADYRGKTTAHTKRYWVFIVT